MKEIRLCLTGELRSGKSTLAEYAEDVHYMMPFAFGDEMKADFHREYPHVPSHPKPRKGYQLYAQLQRYVHGESYWLDKCFAEIDKMRQIAAGYNSSIPPLEDGVKVPIVQQMFMPIITDVRQANEFAACRMEGYTVIRVVSTIEQRIHRAQEAGDKFGAEDLQHETEEYISSVPVDYTIVNTGSKQDMYDQFDKLMEKLLMEKASA